MMVGKVDCDAGIENSESNSNQQKKPKQGNVGKLTNARHVIHSTLCYLAVVMAIVSTILSIYNITQLNENGDVVKKQELPSSAAVIGVAPVNAVQDISSINTSTNPTAADYTDLINEIKLIAASITEMTTVLVQDAAILEEAIHFLQNETENLKINESELTNTTMTLSQRTTALNSTTVALSREVAENTEEAEIVGRELARISEDTSQLNKTASILSINTAVLTRDIVDLIQSASELKIVTTNLNFTTATLAQQADDLAIVADKLNENITYNRENIIHLIEEVNITTSIVTQSLEASKDLLDNIEEVMNVTASNLTEATEINQRRLVEYFNDIEEGMLKTIALNLSFTRFADASREIVFECDAYMYAGSCYWVNIATTPDKARSICERSIGGHLAYITTQVQFDYILNQHRRQRSPLQMWLGGIYDQATGQITLDNGDVSPFMSWGSSEPIGNSAYTRLGMRSYPAVSRSLNGFFVSLSTSSYDSLCQKEYVPYE